MADRISEWVEVEMAFAVMFETSTDCTPVCLKQIVFIVWGK